jgi:hypothetical protein
MRPDDWNRRKPPTNAIARIQKTNLAELRIAWSTGQNSFSDGERG